MSSTPEILSSTPESGQSSADADDFVESKQQPLWHVIVLNVLTLSAYSVIWFWKTWKDLAEHANKIELDSDASAKSDLSDVSNNPSPSNASAKAAKISAASANPGYSAASAKVAKLSAASANPDRSAASANPNLSAAYANSNLLKFRKTSPTLQTMALLIPIVQLFQTSLLFSRIASLYPAPESFIRKKPIATGILMSVSMFLLFSLYKLPGPLMLLFLLYVAPFVIAQSWLNRYWKTQEQPDVLVRQAFSAGELVSLILGAVLLGLMVTGFAINH